MLFLQGSGGWGDDFVGQNSYRIAAGILLGMVALCIGDLWLQLWPSITIPMGLTLAFTDGAIGIVSGIALLLTPGYKV